MWKAKDEGGITARGKMRLAGSAGAAALFCVPMVAMRFTREVTWTAFDFAVLGAMLLGAGLALEIAVRLGGGAAYRAGAALAVAAAFLLVWITGAVGLVGSEDHPANLLVLAAPVVALAGAAVARGRSLGMARAMLAAGLLQSAVGLLAVAMGWGVEAPRWPADVLALSAGFTALWLASAGLFQTSATRR